MTKYELESELKDDIIKAANDRRDVRLFKNDVGQCRESNIGLRYGLFKGSSDLIGWQAITITEDMVGKKVAVFAAVELKIKDRIASDVQKTFIRNVRKFGGIGCVARDVNDIQKIFGKEEGNL